MATKSAGGAPAAPEGKTVLAPEQVAALKQSAKRASDIEKALSGAIDAWWIDHIHNSPVSQATEAYAHIHGRLDALKAAVANALKEV